MCSKYWSCDPSVGVTLQVGESGPSTATPMTVTQVFQQTVKDYGNCLALAVKRAGIWKKWTYQQYYHSCITAAKAFIKVYES